MVRLLLLLGAALGSGSGAPSCKGPAGSGAVPCSSLASAIAAGGDCVTDAAAAAAAACCALLGRPRLRAGAGWAISSCGGAPCAADGSASVNSE